MDLRRLLAALVGVMTLTPSVLGRSVLHESISEPFVGVRLIERQLDEPRRLFVNIAEIDTTAPGIRFVVTPKVDGLDDGDETVTQNVGEYLEQTGAQLAFNGSFFRLEHHSKQLPTNNISLVASGGDVYSPWEQRMPFALALAEDNTPRIVTPADGDAFFNAVAGNVVLVKGGLVPDIERMPGTGKMNDKHPRTAVGITADGKLLVVTVDGRQPGFSEGLFLDELGQLLADLGAVDALNLDGGGSTTLAVDYFGDERAVRLVNSATGRGIVGSQRNNGVNVAIFAEANPEFVPPTDQPVIDGAVVLEAFEDGEGNFNGDFVSGSNVGIDVSQSRIDQVLHSSAVGVGAKRIAVTATDDAEYTAVRVLSGGGEPSANVLFAATGAVGFYARNLGDQDIGAALLLDDDAQLERGTLRTVPADGRWHLLTWTLDDAGDWENFNAGDGAIDAKNVTIDALYLRAAAGTDICVEWDQLMHIQRADD